ncbi:MAG: SDR family oxidoreductase [Rhodospirillaceae bacterium]|nr:SDR family oxidoreductase [Rhodospirillaceae bacterium]
MRARWRADPMTQLADKIIVVTGAGRGLGRAFAEGAAKAGAAAIVVAELVEEWGRAAAEALAKDGFEASFVPLDLGDPASVAAMAETVGKRYGRIDGLVNNGAIATGIGGKTFEEIDLDTWDRVMRVNVRGTWLAVKACAPWLRKGANGARVVNIASDTALWGAPRLLHYVASKGAVIAMTRSLARELGPDRIAVNAVAPGLTLVEATEYVPKDRHDQYVTGRAIPRAQMPDDVVGAVLYLLSDGAAFVTGQLLPVNGGFVLN